MTQPRPLWTDTALRLEAGTELGPVPVVTATPNDAPRGTVLLVHGRNGAPGQAQIAEIAEAYLARGWRVAAPELPHSIALPDSGPSDQVTFTGHTRAAAGVWAWLAQTWPDQRRALAGHSIGAYAIAHLAGDDPGTDHILAVSPPLSGMVLLSARVAMGPDAVEAVKREAPLFHAEMPIADAAPALARSHAPLAVVTGAEDGLVRLKDARAYFNAAPNGRFFGALPNEHHCPAGKACADMLAAALVAVGA
jgi:alpha-beta hydrolase superfamily lysophospholipase